MLQANRQFLQESGRVELKDKAIRNDIENQKNVKFVPCPTYYQAQSFQRCRF
jgi:hypothetical protein